MTFDGSGTITGLAAGGLPNGSVTADDLAAGAARANFGAGAVLQVVRNSTEGSSSTNSATFVDVTNLTVSITPSSASSTVLIVASGRLGNTLVGGVNPVYNQRLMRDATELAASNLSADSGSGGLQAKGSLAFVYRDSPATTSPTTYKIQHRSTSASSFGTCDQAWIVAMEIAG